MTISPSEITKYIKGVKYPASIYDINSKARENHAPDMVIDIINYIPERRFRSFEEVDEAVTRCIQ